MEGEEKEVGGGEMEREDIEKKGRKRHSKGEGERKGREEGGRVKYSGDTSDTCLTKIGC